MADGISSFVEFETASDLKIAVEKLDNQEFKGANVRCEADVRRSSFTTCIVNSSSADSR